MQFFQNLTVKYKIALFAFISILGFAIYLTFSAFVTSANNDRLEEIREVDFTVLEAVNENWIHLIKIETKFTSAIFEENEDLLEEARVLGGQIQDSFEKIKQFSPSSSEKVDDIKRVFTLYFDLADAIVVGSIEGNLERVKKREMLGSMRNAYTEFKDKQEAFKLAQTKAFSDRLKDTQDNASQSLSIGLLLASIMVVILGATCIFITRLIVTPLQYAVNIVKQISTGDWNVEVNVSAKDETGKLLYSIKNMRDTLRERITADLSKQNESLDRIKTALDSASTSICIISEKGDFLYHNNAFLALYNETLNTVDHSTDILGVSIYDASDELMGLKAVTENISETQHTNIVINASTLNIIANPVIAQNGQLLGITLEWKDLTAELNTQLELDRVINQTVKGDFSSRVELSGMSGVMLKMGTGLNQLIETTATGLDETGRVLKAISIGDINTKVQSELPGSFGELKDHCNNTIDELRISMGELSELVKTANAGDFNSEIPIENKTGFFKELAEGLNLLMKTTNQSLSDFQHVISQMAKGDLTVSITSTYQGIFEQLKNDTNTTLQKLTSTIRSIRDTAGIIYTGSNEIATGNLDLSTRTESQASSLEETAASMEEMATSVKESSTNASKSKELADDARNVAESGGSVVKRAIDAMSAINKSSSEIADIISVIDEIAFQTNLLALNAAVEAARAGEEGRGFAVVAAEVRSLAQRSAGAAKKIKELINDSGNRVKEGTVLVNETGTLLNNIMLAVQNVSNSTDEISEASIEQNAGIQQVNSAISQIDNMTQQNAALVEEAAAASESMSEQSQEMIKLLNFFRIN